MRQTLSRVKDPEPCRVSGSVQHTFQRTRHKARPLIGCRGWRAAELGAYLLSLH